MATVDLDAELSQHQKRRLDLAFAMDCTSSMGPYIDSARNHIRTIVNEIVTSENTDVRLALVEYRDHPPEDKSFVTRTHDFTANPTFMRRWLDDSSANGGGDCPEALADALKDVFDLTWREASTKICVLISDAPPHGLGSTWDGYPNGCPLGIDPVSMTNQLAAKGVTLYVVGCEPAIRPYKDFFMALAYITGGQYVPLLKAQLLTKVIIGGAQEEISLEQFMSEVDQEVKAEVAAGREIDEDEFVLRIHYKLQSKGANTKQLQRNDATLDHINASPIAKQMSNQQTLAEVRKLQSHVPQSTNMISFDTATPMSAKGIAAFDPLSSPSRMANLDAYKATKGGTAATRFGHPQAPWVGNAPNMAAPAFEDYKTVEAGISYGQSARMVQKAIARNCAKKKTY